jgi:regulator of RNase E activity RraA
MPTPGSIAILQQPSGQVCAVCGDILATRLKIRGVHGLVADGRVRDIIAMRDLSSSDNFGSQAFTAWSRGTSTVGTGLEAKAWAADVPLRIGGLEVKAGDLLCADEGERGLVVIPQEKVEELMSILPGLKEADERCVADVQAGVEVSETFRRHR